MLGELIEFARSPYTWLAVCVGSIVGVWWWQMNATYANLTLVFGVMAGMAFTWLHPWMATHAWPVRTLGTTATGSILGLLVYFTLWVPQVSLGFMARLYSADQQVGAVVGGIAWNPAFSETHLLIMNDSNIDVRDVDIVMRTDQPIAAVGQIAPLSNVSIAPHDLPVFDSEWVNLQTQQRTAMGYTLLATLKGYRLRADVFPRRSRIEIVMAAVTIHESNPAAEDKLLAIHIKSGQSVWFAHPNHTNAVFGAKPMVRRVFLTGKYSAREREREFNEAIEAIDYSAGFFR